MSDKILKFNGLTNQPFAVKDFLEDMSKVVDEEKVVSVVVIALTADSNIGVFTNSPDKYEAYYLTGVGQQIISKGE